MEHQAQLPQEVSSIRITLTTQNIINEFQKKDGDSISAETSLETYTHDMMQHLLRFSGHTDFQVSFKNRLERMIKSRFNRFQRNKEFRLRAEKAKAGKKTVYHDQPATQEKPATFQESRTVLDPSAVFDRISKLIEQERDERNRKICLFKQSTQVISCFDFDNRIRIELFCPQQFLVPLIVELDRLGPGAKVKATLIEFVNGEKIQSDFFCIVPHRVQTNRFAIVVNKK